jgi:hypothetical protein
MLAKARVVLCALAALPPAEGIAQVFAGPEFRLSASTTTNNTIPSLTMTPAGDFVVSWSAQSLYDNGASVRRFDGAAVPAGPEVVITPLFGDGRNGGHDIAADRAGNFVVVWVNDDRDGSYRGVFGRRFDATGAPLGADFQVNTYTTGSQGDFFPGSIDVARAPDGRFVVVWEGAQGFVSGRDVFGQRYDAAGNPAGAEFLVNTYTTSSQYRPRVAMDDAGNFVVVWSSNGQDGSFAGVFGQRFAASGAPQASEFRVNTYTTGYQSGSQYSGLGVARAPNGEFIVVWDDSARTAVFGQRYDASGSPAGGEFQVTTPSHLGAAVAIDRLGNFVVTSMLTYSYNVSAAFGQRYAADGTARGSQFSMDLSNSILPHRWPAVASDDVGNFLVVWYNVNGVDGRNVRGQRFGGLRPTTLSVDAPGNGVWEPGETAVVQPTWRNFNGADQTFGGTLANITGPAGATYGITDGTASYGTVGNDTAAQCTDCYSVSVNNPARPVQHWDASVVETITPDAQGQQKKWVLHVGKSFTDVPSASPFYRFVETLLHKGVTGGCGGTNYCPSTPTTRDQMSVFVLVAKEGAGYTPVACGTPVFADVSASNPFCRFIEELSRRGVVSGCGSGNYCPGSPVTRDQMAIFVLRTLDPALNPPACSTPSMFPDVPATSPFCRWVEELARRGVVTGCGGGNYCPSASVTREQMGVFISATFGLTLYGT